MTTALKTTGEVNTQENPKIDKRQAIIWAARDLFTTEGYETTTIAQVAKKAGVAVGTVYLYFKNKYELLFAVKCDYEMQFVQYMQEPELLAIPHHLRARRIVETAFAIASEKCELVQLMGLQPQMIGEGLETHAGGPIIEALIRFMEDAKAAGSFRDVDSQAGAVIGFGMVHAALHQCFEVEGGRDQEKYIHTLVDSMIHWLVKPELLEEAIKNN